ncbi:MAG: transcriptional regulator, TetR family [Mycobacterium sp.]|nr:transcriptional regulator, TetR family [Mycobacterium sp.]
MTHGGRRGRPPSTSADRIARVALELFARRGYEATTMEDVAAAVGVGRSTLFRYFPSKGAIVWAGRRETEEAVSGALAAVPAAANWRVALPDALASGLCFPGDDEEALRLRLRLIGSVPELQAGLAAAAGPAVADIAQFIAVRMGLDVGDLIPYTLARSVLATVLAALVWWGGSDVGDPRSVVRRAVAAALGLPADPGSREVTNGTQSR